MPTGGNDEDTVILRRSPPGRRRIGRPVLLAISVCAAVCFGLWAIILSRGPGGVPIDRESEAEIDATQPCAIKVSRLAQDSDIVVIDFPDLRTQGLMLDRVAALVEKAHLPRDRVLDDVELNEAIYSCGETIESYYYGHDYRTADLAQFFALAAADGIPLNRQELWLKSLLGQLGWLQPGASGAIITLPGVAPPVNEEMRAVILHHEISHGAFYTVPPYADYATMFWRSLSEDQRAAFRNFLGAEGYDTSNETLMLNETQAYLVFTRDPQFFNGSVVGMSAAQIEALRTRYIAAMPSFWLKDMANETLPVGPAPAACAIPD
jgi:hypothetical protein